MGDVVFGVIEDMVGVFLFWVDCFFIYNGGRVECIVFCDFWYLFYVIILVIDVFFVCG